MQNIGPPFPPQSDCESGHTQCPAQTVAGAEQMVPHAPQLFWSLLSSTQVAPSEPGQLERPAEHPHVPASWSTTNGEGHWHVPASCSEAKFALHLQIPASSSQAAFAGQAVEQPPSFAAAPVELPPEVVAPVDVAPEPVDVPPPVDVALVVPPEVALRVVDPPELELPVADPVEVGWTWASEVQAATEKTIAAMPNHSDFMHSSSKPDRDVVTGAELFQRPGSEVASNFVRGQVANLQQWHQKWSAPTWLV
jgi:hypothetical protein